MTRTKKVLVAGGGLLVVGLYAYFYGDWFRATEIQIYHRQTGGRPIGSQTRTNQLPPGASVVFGLNRKYELTDVKVMAVREPETNNPAHLLWHLVSDSNSVPVNGFVYGERIRGMRPSIKRARAESLRSNVIYRVIVEAGRQKGQHDFSLGGATSSTE